MIHYDRTSPYANELEKALDLLDPRLRNAVDARDTTIVAVPGHATFFELTKDPATRSLDRKEQFGIVHGAYAVSKQLMVLRTSSRAVVRPSLAAVLAHESVHVRDYAAGDGTLPFSKLDPFIESRYRDAKDSGYAISRYSLVNRCEFVAETARAVMGYNATIDDDRARLLNIDPDLFTYIDAWLSRP